MKIEVRAKPGAKTDKVEPPPNPLFSDGSLPVYKVWVKAPAKEGKANQAIIRLLAEHLGVPAGRISLIRGATSKTKLLEVE